MLYVQEKVVKLGGIYLEGQVTSVEVQEAGRVIIKKLNFCFPILKIIQMQNRI